MKGERSCGSAADGGKSLQSFVSRITQNTTSTTTITILTPPEDPNAHTTFFLCTRKPFGSCGDDFTWFKIDITHAESTSTSTAVVEKKKKKKKNLKLLSPISHMPHTTPWFFRPVPDPRHKLIYAFGGLDCGGPKITFSSKAFFCDMDDTTNNDNFGIWHQLPPIPSPLKIHSAVVSPLNNQAYVFGFVPARSTLSYNYAYRRSRGLLSKESFDSISDAPGGAGGMVFNPISGSWAPCSPPRAIKYFDSVTDYTLVQNENNPMSSSRFVVFNGDDQGALLFDLANLKWENEIFPTLPRDPFHDRFHEGKLEASCVGVSSIIYKLIKRKLFLLDLTIAHPCFKEVKGFEDTLPTYEDTTFKGYLFYIGRGKLCIVWGGAPSRNDKEDNDVVMCISCLTFWVGTCNRKNELRAIFDECHRYFTRDGGAQLYEVIAM